MPPLGFVVLTHTKPRQIERLLRRLHSLFDAPPIVCHHDFGQCDLDTRQFPQNIRFLRPHLATAWGLFSVVQATVACLRVLYESPASPDWFALLSGADYPTSLASVVLADLETAATDAYMDYEEIDADCPRRAWQATCAKRYLNKTGHSPFSDRFRLFAGSQWFTANRRCARYTLDWVANKESYDLHYRSLHFPEESYFQSIVCNEPALTISHGNKRYIDWNSGPTYPRTLDISDLPRIVQSQCHFARKCDLELAPALYDALDDLTAQGHIQESKSVCSLART